MILVPTRRWYRFGLRGLFLIVSLSALGALAVNQQVQIGVLRAKCDELAAQRLAMEQRAARLENEKHLRASLQFKLPAWGAVPRPAGPATP